MATESSEPETKEAEINEEEEEVKVDIVEEEEEEVDIIDVDDSSSDDDAEYGGSDGGDSSYDSADEYDSPEHCEQFCRYRQQVIDSDGFDVDVPDCPVLGGILPIHLDGPSDMAPWEAVRPCAEAAVKEKNLQLVDVIKANCALVDGLMYYITLSAKSSSSSSTEEEQEPPKIYQAKVWYGFADDDIVVRFIRLKDEKPSHTAS